MKFKVCPFVITYPIHISADTLFFQLGCPATLLCTTRNNFLCKNWSSPISVSAFPVDDLDYQPGNFLWLSWMTLSWGQEKAEINVSLTAPEWRGQGHSGLKVQAALTSILHLQRLKTKKDTKNPFNVVFTHKGNLTSTVNPSMSRWHTNTH